MGVRSVWVRLVGLQSGCGWAPVWGGCRRLLPVRRLGFPQPGRRWRRGCLRRWGQSEGRLLCSFQTHFADGDTEARGWLPEVRARRRDSLCPEST